ncbi:MAG: hypothetical protein EPN34_11305 [Burkholderiaceae bacterium]|nr:MAG: hypothetical protein EPN34_11305 [Burkholderiaceae bacterium]
MQDVLFVLGAGDPEMVTIEHLLADYAVPAIRVRVGGKRVYPANAYRASVPPQAVDVLARGGRVWLVECVGDVPEGASRIDHHRPGDPGYGHPPAEFWRASSLGQAVAVLRNEIGLEVEITPEMRLVAAADHCLGAAYRGDCPGIDPDALLRWHVASRAAFEKRSVDAVLIDVQATRDQLRRAPRMELAPGIHAADMRGRPDAELLIAAAHEGQCCISAVTARDGRTKIGCLVGSPAQVMAFMHEWVPRQGLTAVYGDPVRGFAGAFVPR